jgi:hypothetical protein
MHDDDDDHHHHPPLSPPSPTPSQLRPSFFLTTTTPSCTPISPPPFPISPPIPGRHYTLHHPLPPSPTSPPRTTTPSSPQPLQQYAFHRIFFSRRPIQLHLFLASFVVAPVFLACACHCWGRNAGAVGSQSYGRWCDVRHTSHVTRHTSHVTRHTSHITHHTSHSTSFPHHSFQATFVITSLQMSRCSLLCHHIPRHAPSLSGTNRALSYPSNS